jgi:sugar lactone lactonase YvrE
MYFADSQARAIEQSRLDDEHMPTQWTPFSKPRMGSPDGSCVDAQGCLWNAEWLAWRLVRYSPDGQVDRVIEVPASRPSCCTFGGPDYKTLFVTSAQHKMTAQEKQQERTAGSLYQIDFDDAKDVQGLPADLFAM